MTFLQNQTQRFQKYSFEEKLLILSTISIFLPMPITALWLMLVLGWGIFHKKISFSWQKNDPLHLILLFSILEIIVSFFYQNFIGVGNAIGILFVALYIMFYRQTIHKDLFHVLLNIVLVGSVIVAIYGLFEFQYLSELKGYSFFDFHVQNSPKGRIHVFFGNANLYAMMIEFFIAICLYQWVNTNSIQRKTIYVMIGLLNIGMLYLTGCRAAFIPLAIIVPLFFIIYGNKKYITIALSLIGLGFICIFLFPDLIPRLDDLKTVNSRFKIWNGAIQIIQMYPLLGNGPQAYGHLNQIYHWHKAPHAHNIYLDSLASYGLIGTLILLRSIYLVIKEQYKIRNDKARFALFISIWTIILVHGFFDCTLNVLCTSMLALMILFYTKEK